MLPESLFFGTPSRSQRVLPKEAIPPVLWEAPTLHIPSDLIDVYLSEIDRLGLRQRCVGNSDDGIHGGQSEEETHNHFALRFCASSGRVVYTILAPTEEFIEFSNAFLSSFSTGHIALLDIPCGTGALSATLICTLINLRKARLLPRLPLTITIGAGDFSPSALALFDIMLREITPKAASQGITVRSAAVEWNATRSDQTAALVDQWFAAAVDATEYFVVICNFSGAIKNNEQFANFSPCFEHILARLHDKISTLVWLEPQTKSAKRGVFKWAFDFIKHRKWWFSGNAEDREPSTAAAEYELQNPVSLKSFASNVLVQRFDRT